MDGPDLVEEYLQSLEFSETVDGVLYETAVRLVVQYFGQVRNLPAAKNRPAKKNQVRGIQILSRKHDLVHLKTMAQNQLRKAKARLRDPKTDESSDSLLWSIIRDSIENNAPGRFSLQKYAKTIVLSKEFFPTE